MGKLSQRATLETAFGSYVLDELIGEGGAGRVFGGLGSDGTAVAVKVLAAEHLSSGKKRRFKNEIAFLARNRHPNIVTVLDHGVASLAGINGPFYVMHRYDGNLRQLITAGMADMSLHSSKRCFGPGSDKGGDMPLIHAWAKLLVM
jgi:serine/threonine protein kinase